MGFTSYECKHCGHSILSSYSADPEINKWMMFAVVLIPGGTRLVGEHDGHSGVAGANVGEGSIPTDTAVWVHQACWEKAGKPEYEDYDGPSPFAQDQGYFFRYEHDMIDPRITNPTERMHLLEEGRTAREKRWYNVRARKVADWLDPSWHPEKEPWRHRFSYWKHHEHDDDRHWFVSDDLNPDWPEWERLFEGTEEELEADLAAKWATFLESDECKAYLARAAELAEEARQEQLQQLKEKGRYRTTYGPKYDDDGKEIAWPVYQVLDELTYKCDNEEFIGDGCKTRCQEKADRMNAEWAAAGYSE